MEIVFKDDLLKKPNKPHSNERPYLLLPNQSLCMVQNRIHSYQNSYDHLGSMEDVIKPIMLIKHDMVKQAACRMFGFSWSSLGEAAVALPDKVTYSWRNRVLIRYKIILLPSSSPQNKNTYRKFRYVIERGWIHFEYSDRLSFIECIFLLLHKYQRTTFNP